MDNNYDLNKRFVALLYNKLNILEFFGAYKHPETGETIILGSNVNRKQAHLLCSHMLDTLEQEEPERQSCSFSEIEALDHDEEIKH